MFARKRLRAPLFVSLQTRPADAVGTRGFAFWTPYRTPSPLLGAGIVAGDYRQEAGRQIVQQQVGVNLSYGGLYSGTAAMQNLVDGGYVSREASNELARRGR